MTAVPTIPTSVYAPQQVVQIPAVQMGMPPALPRTSVLADPERVRINLKAAEFFAASDLVPVHYRGKAANCFIAINRAQRLNIDEMYFMEKTFIVGGRMGIAAELAIELANCSGRFRHPIKFTLHGEGDDRACTASAILTSSGETVENTVSYKMAKDDGWTRNTKWNSLRDQMLQYRSGVFLARLYCGGALGGMYTREELEDVQAADSRRAIAQTVAESQTVRDQRAKAQDRVTPLIELKTPTGTVAAFPRTKHGVESALKQMMTQPELVILNLDFLDMVAEKMPALSDQVAEVRAAAAKALTPPDDAGDGDEVDDWAEPSEG